MGGLLLVAALFTGLLAMHGLQSTQSPLSASGLPGVHTARSGPMPDVVPTHVSNGVGVGVGATIDGSSGGLPVHRHPGGEVCLGLFAATWLLMLLIVAFGLRPGRRGVARPRRPRRFAPGRSPPTRSIFQLAVLRL